MLIAQITDIHLGFERDNAQELNRRRLDSTIEALLAVEPTPDLLILSGDLADRGEALSYRQVRDALAVLPFPIAACVGNHDSRSNFCAAFPDTPLFDGFVQYVLDDWPLRIVTIDTLEEGRHDGAFCERRARWLDERLGEAPGMPVLLVLHHPPVPTGINWMTSQSQEPWAVRLSGVVSRHNQVIAAVCGHLHRPMIAPWAGTTLIVCPPVAPLVVLDLSPMDQPDHRPMIVADPPGYALHLWTAGGLVTHFGAAESGEVLARYDQTMHALVRSFGAERDERERPAGP
ncbi:MAG TPA: metallophosphoesterase [Caulobacteraceae bacterium]